jgi:Ca-activated chloride channel family protein
MKLFVLIGFLVAVCATNTGWSQEWRDSLNHARKLYKNGSYKEALKYYKSAERLAPNDVDLSEEKGQSAYRAKDYKEAEKSFNSATVRQTDKKRKVAAYNNLGNARMRQENYKGAEDAFKEALRLDPANEKARQLLAQAKRLRREKQQKEQQEQEQKQQNQDNQQQNQDPKKGDQQQKPQQSGQGQKNQQQNQQNQQNSGQSGKETGKQQQGAAGKEEQKLADKQTERKLDELMRQEMDAKKRIDGSKGNSNGKKAKKDW